MRTRRLIALVLSVLVAVAGAPTAAAAEGDDPSPVLVTADAVSESGTVSLVVTAPTGEELDPVTAEQAVDRVDEAVDGPVHARTGEMTTRIEVPFEDAQAAVEAVQELDGVHFAGFDVPVKAALTPTDPFWFYNVTILHDPFGRTDMTSAWERTTGSSDVTIAILDTGVTPVSELSGRVTAGYDFVNGDTDPADDEGHGTLAAVIAAGAGNNGVGAAGGCWGCLIMPVKVLDDEGFGWQTDLAEGIKYATDNGADIISMSLSGSIGSAPLQNAVAYAAAADVLMFAAAGNDGATSPTYPGNYPQVIAVAGTDTAGVLHHNSNRGTWINLSAPFCSLSQSRTEATTIYCGTSAATPFAASAAALALDYGATPAAVHATYGAGATPITNGGVGELDADDWIDAAFAASAEPTITITDPAPSSRLGRLGQVKWDAADVPSTATVELYLDDTLLVTRPVTDGQANIVTINVSEGMQTLELRAVDGAEVVASDQLVVNHVNAPSNYVWSNQPVPATAQAGSIHYGGAPGDRSLMCDFDGDGIDTPVIVRNSNGAMVWLAKHSLSGGNADQTVFFGSASDTPVCGDWNGDGADGPGVFRAGMWYLRDEFSTGAANRQFGYGSPGDYPVVGDWDGDGVDGVAVGRSAVFFMRNTLSTGIAEKTVHFGAPSDVYVAGDWDGDGIDTLGVYRNGKWLLKNSNTSGTADFDFWFGTAADLPYVGDFNGDGIDTPMVGR